MDEDAASAATGQEDIQPSESIENLDLSAPDGEIAYVDEGKDTEDTEQVAEDDNTQEDVSQDRDTETPDTKQESSQEDTTTAEGMSEKERNNYFAQQRLAAKQAKEQNDQFMGDLRKLADEKYVNDTNEETYEDMDPATAEQLKGLQQFQKQMEVDRALEQLERSRESTALSFTQAETAIPLFNPNHKDYNPVLHEEAMKDWAEAYLDVQADRAGNPQVVGVKQGAPSPLDYMSEKADRYADVLKHASARGQAIAQRNRSTAEQPSTQKVSRRGDNTLEALEERIGNISLA